MGQPSQGILLGHSLMQIPTGKVDGGYVALLGEPYYFIRNYDRMPPFFMSIVSSTDHWMFISSTGGLSAGRSNSESAIFPYYTDDRLTEDTENTGPVAILRVKRQGKKYLWQPFSSRGDGLYKLERALYKNKLGDKLIFEENNLDLGLRYRYGWRFSDRYGLVKTAWLSNLAQEACQVTLLDGVQNVLPCGATTHMQNNLSNLLNAYKRNELDPETELGAFSLSSILSDMAEPSESLKATTIWQIGLQAEKVLLSTEQVDKFRRGGLIHPETDIRGRRGVYLVQSSINLAAGKEVEWHLVIEVNQDSTRAAAIKQELRQPAELKTRLLADIASGSSSLEAVVASADGLQFTADALVGAHHLSNVLFNVMRGGIFPANYQVRKDDLVDFIAVRNQTVLQSCEAFFNTLPVELTHAELMQRAETSDSPDLERLCYEYLPLTFGRRHGDPSRPWNRFSINLKKPDGSQKLDYQGNWRDIFQNWEPLAWSFPEYVEPMICKFLNATTADGYNPYRITRAGIEWEVPTPGDPWANFGYWGDHQIIYLEKLLEISEKFHPGKLHGLLDRKIFSHANIPYHIKPYSSLLQDWSNTINFEREAEGKIQEMVKEVGTDGKLVRSGEGGIFHVTMLEKLLILLLAKVGNFVPEGGIWMNTQRPEWNDGNNALVGKGLSVVTLGYLRRFVVFFTKLLTESPTANFPVSTEVRKLFLSMRSILHAHQKTLAGSFDDEERRCVMDELGQAGSTYREKYYQKGVSGEFASLERQDLAAFLEVLQDYIDHSLRANRRSDNLYHAYNVLHLSDGKASISHLYEMLEGQVAILSSGMLTCADSLALLKSLRKSPMYRADQHSYTLYPDRDLPGFFQKNCISARQVNGSRLIAELVKQGDASLIVKDTEGIYHFNGDFRNARHVTHALQALKDRPSLAELVDEEAEDILELFERTFDHHSFTGRSGTFFAYEGLGSIYWHMVTKLLLAVEETVLRARDEKDPKRVQQGLMDTYDDIRKGLGFNKSPEVYGAFPTDPYSHTPAGQGAKQPGMTGQVKEEILTRWAELGLSVDGGCISFKPYMLDKREFNDDPAVFYYVNVAGQPQAIDLPAHSLAFTFCQVPVVYFAGAEEKIEIVFQDGKTLLFPGTVLQANECRHIFCRDGQIKEVQVSCRL